MILLGYLLGFLMGMTLGLLGAGGSILTVPILVYCFQIQPLNATGYSLFMVGTIALTGAYTYFKQNLVDVRSGALFCLPAMAAVWLTRRYLLPELPEPILEVETVTLSKDCMIMILFGILMLTSAYFMFRRSKDASAHLPNTSQRGHGLGFLILSSAGIGLLTGLVGVGGGFIIVPTLITLFKLPVKMAVGTSLMVIAMNSLTGFYSDIASGLPIDTLLLTTFLVTTLSGMLAGTSLNKIMESANLCKGFAVLTLVSGAFILQAQYQDIVKHLNQESSRVSNERAISSRF